MVDYVGFRGGHELLIMCGNGGSKRFAKEERKELELHLRAVFWTVRSSESIQRVVGSNQLSSSLKPT
jgi:hypothetical protein